MTRPRLLKKFIFWSILIILLWGLLFLLPIGLETTLLGLRVLRAFIYAAVVGSSLIVVQQSIIPRLRLFAINIQFLLKFTIYASTITISYGILSISEIVFFSEDIFHHIYSINVFSLLAKLFFAPISGQAAQQLIPEWVVAIFFFLVSLIILIIIVSLVFSLIDTKWHQYASEKQLSEARLRMLENQLKPHFLFNTLNTIVSVVRSDPPKAETILLELSDFLRYNFDFANRQTVPIEDEIHFTELYLSLLKTRFENLEWKIQIDEATKKMNIPVLIMQPPVENAIIHGWDDPDKKFQITINVIDKNQSLLIEIIDNGLGISEIALKGVPTKGHALYNIRERLKLIYGNDHLLTISSEPQKATKIAIFIPRDIA